MHPAARPKSSDPVFQSGNAAHFRAMGTTENFAIGLDAVADHAAIAVRAPGSQEMDGAFETVERVTIAMRDHLE
jgi:hypothetical protein